MRYLYLTRGGPFAKLMLMLGAVWAALTAVIILRPTGDRKTLALISLIYPLAYLAMSGAVSIRRRGKRLQHV
jgi:hypothetical protein